MIPSSPSSTPATKDEASSDSFGSPVIWASVSGQDCPHSGSVVIDVTTAGVVLVVDVVVVVVVVVDVVVVVATVVVNSGSVVLVVALVVVGDGVRLIVIKQSE